MGVLNAQNVLLPVEMDAVQLTICRKKPQVQTMRVWWPLLKMSAWAKTLVDCHPQVLLCGYTLKDERWKQVLGDFWASYEINHGDHELFQSNLSERPMNCCIPYFLHGDEGRFLRNKPLMIEAWQPAISHRGPSFTNESGLLDFIQFAKGFWYLHVL